MILHNLVLSEANLFERKRNKTGHQTGDDRLIDINITKISGIVCFISCRLSDGNRAGSIFI